MKASDEASDKSEAGRCSECGGTVYHREGKPGEYDHTCVSAVRYVVRLWRWLFGRRDKARYQAHVDMENEARRAKSD